MFNRYLFNLSIAWQAILANKMRAILTALGIVFGVAAVISMLAIGNGAQQEILEQIKLVGVNNIVINPIWEQSTASELEETDQAGDKSRFSQGLTLKDAKSLLKNIPTIQKVSPEVVVDLNVIYQGNQRKTKLVGVEPAHFELIDFKLSQGSMFSTQNLERGDQVCIIGRGIESKLFSGESALGKSIKCGNYWLKIIGILEAKNLTTGSISNLGIRDYDMDIYTPVKTALIRFQNRNMLTKAQLTRATQEEAEAEEIGQEKADVNYHQLDRLVIQVKETKYLRQTAEIIGRALKRRHFNEIDFEIEIPELLLKQQQRTKDIFNLVLGVIAGISLLVGGIGIMNIMLASVLERIKEIGLRLSIGAKKTDITLQFMFEATLISLSGGIIGIILGVVMAQLITQIAQIPTIISFSSIAISFFVSATVGLVFGIAPAQKAARQDPITSLRYE